MFTRHHHQDTRAAYDDEGVDILRDNRSDAEIREERTRDAAHEQYGGMHLGADFFGWLVALALTALLTGVAGAAAAVVSDQVQVSQSQAEREAGTIGMVAAAVFVAVSAIGYFAGGYVASRMSRFDGGRQGLGVWLIGLVAMVLAAGAGAIYGAEYNVLERVNLPQLPVTGSEAGIGAVVTGATLLVVTLLAALAGGKAGQRFHRRIDAFTRRDGS